MGKRDAARNGLSNLKDIWMPDFKAFSLFPPQLGSRFPHSLYNGESIKEMYEKVHRYITDIHIHQSTSVDDSLIRNLEIFYQRRR